MLVVEQYQRHRQCRQTLLQAALGEQRRRLAVVDHVGQALGRVSRVQRYVGGTGFEYTEQPDDHFHSAFDADRHSIIRTDAQADQVVSETIGLAVQFGIAQALRLEGHGDGVGLCLDLFLEQLMNRAILRVRHVGSVKVDQQTLALRGIEQWYVFQHLAVIGDHGVQQTLQVAQIAGDGAFIEQRSGVFQRTEQLTLGFADVQREIELGQRMARAQALQLQIAKGEIPTAHVLPAEHGLEHRAVRQAAHRLDHFHHLLERQVLMVLGA
ncbi:Uncharacterized protein AC517_0164 [Pseudomonas syringae pv. syringae]|nr:Uncharacterized protein AC517_0164 [Pseudomonas syringae pv. syringae]